MESSHNLIVILGPTASGKTRLAASLAGKLDTDIISADSRQVYRDMNIGTGKDYDDYMVNDKQVSSHLIDIVDAGSFYHLHQYMQDFNTAFREITTRNKVPVLCGGTGLYIDAVLKGYEYASIPVDENLRQQLKDRTRDELFGIFESLQETAYKKLADTSTAKRIIRAIEICSYLIKQKHDVPTSFKIEPIVFGLNPGLELRRKRIEERLKLRLKNGLIEEVKELLSNGISEEKLIFYGLEYKFIMMYLKQELSMEEMTAKLTIAIQQFAKRQMTFFRKMEREGLKIHWIDPALSLPDQLEQVLKSMKQI